MDNTTGDGYFDGWYCLECKKSCTPTEQPDTPEQAGGENIEPLLGDLLRRGLELRECGFAREQIESYAAQAVAAREAEIVEALPKLLSTYDGDWFPEDIAEYLTRNLIINKP